jgi:hypothetical protein
MDECARNMILLGSEVTLDCVVSDAFPAIDPNATVWFQHDTPLVAITEGGLGSVRIDGSRLTIENATSTNSLDYICRASNGVIERDSAVKSISVISEWLGVWLLKCTLLWNQLVTRYNLSGQYLPPPPPYYQYVCVSRIEETQTQCMVTNPVCPLQRDFLYHD